VGASPIIPGLQRQLVWRFSRKLWQFHRTEQHGHKPQLRKFTGE